MYYNVILTLNFILFLTLLILGFIWWRKYGRTIFKLIKSVKSDVLGVDMNKFPFDLKNNLTDLHKRLEELKKIKDGRNPNKK